MANLVANLQCWKGIILCVLIVLLNYIINGVKSRKLWKLKDVSSVLCNLCTSCFVTAAKYNILTQKKYNISSPKAKMTNDFTVECPPK